MPPAFCSHLPMFKPMMFRNTATKQQEKRPDHQERAILRQNALPCPPTYAIIAALAISKPGK